ncbi:tyrosine-type recombinase/integrase [Amycolatopsis sp. cmx-4-54]|uniref:tyrosine-type recombinase/integrase n=1 Tax=Amycolatopsis sp. cmx-4-54 TaxID=2790936 RepID=UPI00397ABF58
MSNELTEWRDEWATALSGGAVSGETVELYLRGVDQFLRWLGEAHPDVTELETVKRKHGDEWLAYLINERKFAPATRRVRLLSIRFWFDYIVDEHDSPIVVNPFAKISLPVPNEKPVPVIPDEELRALLKTAAGRDFISLRDTAIIRLLLDTGARRGEVVDIDLNDVDLERQEITVTGKGRKTRIVPISASTALALRKYLRARAKRPAATSRPLFLSIRPHATGASRLTGGGIGEMISRRCVEAGLGHRWPHQFRHTWAHDLLDNNAAEQVVERLGGWSPGSKMVKRYGSSMADARARRKSKELARGDRV